MNISILSNTNLKLSESLLYLFKSKILKVIKTSSLLTVGNALIALSQWVMVIVVSQYFGKLAMGEYFLYISYLTPVYFVSGLGLRQLYLTNQIDIDKQSGLFWLRVVLFVLFSSIVLLFVYSTSSEYSLSLLLGVCCVRFIELFQDLCHSVWQKKQKFNLIGFSLILKSSSILTFILFCWLGFNVVWSLFFQIIHMLISVTIVDRRAFDDVALRKVFFAAKVKINKKLFKMAIYITLSAFLMSLYINVPRYFIEFYFGFDILAEFISVLILVTSLRFFVQSILQIFLPMMSSCFECRDVKRFITKVLEAITVVILINYMLYLLLNNYGGEIIQIIYGNDYHFDKSTLPYIITYSMLIYSASVVNNALTATRAFKQQNNIAIFVNVVALVSCLLVIESYQITGGYYVLIITSATQLAMSICILYTRLKSITAKND